MNWQQGFWRLGAVIVLSLFSPSLYAQNCTNNQSPAANAGPDRSGNVGVALNFTGAGSDSDGTITAYWFNFGDGSFASWQSSPLASHSFASAGTFSVRLWVKDNCGAMSASDMAMVTISQAPANPCAGNTAPIANAGPDRAGNPNVPLLLTGYASTDIQNNISHYWWNFGDGQYTGWQTSAGVSHAFANTGNYSVRLWVKDSCGAMSAADTVIVSIVNPNPCAGNTPPNAIITSPSSGLVNQSLNFSGLSSSDSTGTIQSYAWNFGDGQSANGVTVSHSYASAGNKTVTLTLTDSCGAQATTSRTISITNPDPCAGNQPPIAQASANPANANLNQSISFSAAGSSDPNGSITSYAWNFGDGSSGSGASASHAYVSTGNFNIVLTITDNCGATATKTISVTITNPNSGIVVSKLTHVDAQTGQETWVSIPDGEEIELGLRVKFEASQLTAGANLITWSFLDGSGSSQPAPTHAYDTPGTYAVQLTVYDQNWIPYTITKTIHVAQGMHMLSMMTAPGQTFRPTVQCRIGNTVWAGSDYAALGVADISTPTALDSFQIMLPIGSFSSVQSMAVTENRLFAVKAEGNGLSQIRVLRTSPTFGDLGVMPATVLDGHNPIRVASLGTTLYVALSNEPSIYVLDVSSGEAVHISTLEVSGTTGGDLFTARGQMLICLHSNGSNGALTFFDASNNTSPNALPFSVPLPFGSNYTLRASDEAIAVKSNVGTSVIRLDGILEGSIPFVQTFPVIGVDFVANATRFYLYSDVHHGTISKYDITNWEQPPVLMQELNTQQGQMTTPFLYAPGGVGTDPVLFFGFNPGGYMAVHL